MQYHYVLQIDLGNGAYSVIDGYLDMNGCLDMDFKNQQLKPEKIIFQNNYATIVYWNDGTKTVVKRADEDDKFIPEVGFAMALVKRIYGNRSEVLRWIENAEIRE